MPTHAELHSCFTAIGDDLAKGKAELSEQQALLLWKLLIVLESVVIDIKRIADSFEELNLDRRSGGWGSK